MSASPATATRITMAPAVVADFPADYWDSFRIASLPGSAAREWARLSLGGSEAGHSLFAKIVWHGILGFDLEPPGAAGTFVGWRILLDTPERFVMEGDGSLMAGRMVFEVSDTDSGTDVVWTTMLHYHRSAARLVWGVAGNVHRALVPRLLLSVRTAMERRRVEKS